MSKEDVEHVSQEGGQQLVGPWRQCVSVGWSASLLRTTLHDAMAPLGGGGSTHLLTSNQLPTYPTTNTHSYAPIMPLMEDRIRQKKSQRICPSMNFPQMVSPLLGWR